MKRRIIPYLLLFLFGSVLLSVSISEVIAQEFREATAGPMSFPGEKDTLICLEQAKDEPGSFHTTFHWPEVRPEDPVLVRVPGLSSAGELRVNGIHMGGDSLFLDAQSYNIGPFLKKGSNRLEIMTNTHRPAICVRLTRRNKLCLGAWDLEMHSPGNEEHLLRFRFFINSYHQRPGNMFSTVLRVYDPYGRSVAEQNPGSGRAPAFGQLRQLEVDVAPDSLIYWLPGRPAIYKAEFELHETTTGQVEKVELPFYLSSYSLEDSLLVSAMDSLILRFPPQDIEPCLINDADSLVQKLRQWDVNAVRSTNTPPAELRFLMGEQGILCFPPED